jgi:two-component system, NarL family, nitrate/nitrite response regulator NarL
MPSVHSQKVSFRSREGNNWLVPSPHKHENVLQTLENPGQTFRVLIVDRDSMSSDLLATALTRDRNFHASGIRAADLLECMADGNAHVVVIGADLDLDSKNGFDLARAVLGAHPSVPIIILLSQPTLDSVINAFRSGARGVFSRQQAVAEFVSCVEHVRKGLIWVGAQETTLLLDAFGSIPSPELAMESGSLPLTLRELQVVKCAARGKTNKAIAKELRLSEHTVKNYLFRAFEKLGVSNRVELLFCLTQRGQSLGQGAANYPETNLRAD